MRSGEEWYLPGTIGSWVVVDGGGEEAGEDTAHADAGNEVEEVCNAGGGVVGAGLEEGLEVDERLRCDEAFGAITAQGHRRSVLTVALTVLAVVGERRERKGITKRKRVE